MESGVVFFAFFTVIAVLAVYLLASETLGLVPVCIVAGVLLIVSFFASKVIADNYNAKKAQDLKKDSGKQSNVRG